MSFRMAITDYESSYKTYFGDRFENISPNSTDDDVKQLYEGWAPEYDQVLVTTASHSNTFDK